MPMTSGDNDYLHGRLSRLNSTKRDGQTDIIANIFPNVLSSILSDIRSSIMCGFKTIKRPNSVPCEGYALSWSRPHQFHDESLQPNSFKRTLYSIAFVGTEEWAKPNNLRFATIINVIPLQLDRGSEFSRFYEAVITKVVVPFEQLLNQLEPPVTYILANVELSWRIRIELGCNSQEKTNSDNDPDDIQWLDSQPVDFVLNISLGSFLSVSSAQMDEILAGLQMSGVRFLRVARGEASRLNQTCGDTGQILPWSWCDQLRISCHSSAGGFLTHRGSNSILKIFMLELLCSLFLFSLDQHPNSNQIVGNWKIGKRMKKEIGT
ncbi:UDP-glycosyltransferase 87A1 [Citrus sinensis]|uniref:UDP-glycosyltransferase 87A1 n=1 Tax=Citrus sinensis TaxID=2711 RepID=A0ACB8IXT6_CITSI|nr:UDP-glycosyltransferase 87A1 [Citrus sinensis]